MPNPARARSPRHDAPDRLASHTSRRSVLKLAAAFSAAPLFVGPALGRAGSPRASEKITLGFIGVGWHGHDYNLNMFLNEDDAHVLAVCDVFADRRERARATVRERRDHDCDTYEDFREMLRRDDIDAIVISTPDHWHTPQSLLALEAGKDVMCEKPTFSIAEGWEVKEAVRKHDAVFQVGLEDRSIVYYHRMAELVRNGVIGELKRIDVRLPSGNIFEAEEEAPVPDGLNYGLWLGPAPYHPYTPSRTGEWEWREISDYSGGTFADWGSHLIDTAQVANFAERTGPVEVQGTGKLPPEGSMGDVPVEYELDYRYANGVQMHVESGRVAIRFEGTEGWLGNEGWRGSLEGSSREMLATQIPDDENKMWPRPPLEHRNFLDCIRSRQATTYTVEDHHRLSTVMHIGNISMQLDGRRLKWDPDNDRFVDDAQADRLRYRERRDDWQNL